MSEAIEKLRELSGKAEPGPWEGPCLNYNADGKRSHFPHIHIGKKNVHRKSKSSWIPDEWEGQCKNSLCINQTSSGGDLQHFDDNAAFIVACVNYVREHVLSGDPTRRV